MPSGRALVVDRFVGELVLGYQQIYNQLMPDYPGVIRWTGRMSMEIIANSDALYHDMEHSMLVTLVGQDILRGKHLLDGGIEPREWLHFVLSLLCHDIGYVRGICPGDQDNVCVIDNKGGTVKLPPGATDAFLTPYHVERGKLFARHRFSSNPLINAEVICENIENTRFPVPTGNEKREFGSFPGLVQAADLIGQMADPGYLRKLPALFYEFEETGATERFGHKTPDDLRTAYPGFFWKMVRQHIAPGLRYLQVTETGRQWIYNLHSHVFSEEHRAVMS
ncbi:MAG: metal-dependent phosphohydrolase [Alphaproteobacteria bacterium]|nr:metal-dependent phosphohydrolase [Alphaproteobacteria bacterium]